MEGVLLPEHSVDQVKLATDLSELPTKNRPGRNAAQVVMQVELDAGQFEVENAGRKPQIARNLVRAGGFCESLLRKVDVAELVVVRVVSRIQLDRLFKVFAGRVEVFFLVVGLAQQVVEVVSVLESEQRLDDGDNPLGLLFRVEQFGKLNTGFDMIGVGLDDFFEDLCRGGVLLDRAGTASPKHEQIARTVTRSNAVGVRVRIADLLKRAGLLDRV
jgi:hypothetical protein